MGAAAVMEGDCTSAVAVAAGEAALANAACTGSNAGSCDCESSGDSCGSCCCSSGSGGSDGAAAACGDAGCRRRLNSDAASPCAAVAADAPRAADAAASERDASAAVSGPSLWRCSRGDTVEGDEVDEKSSDAVESAAAVSAAAREPRAARSPRALRRAIGGAGGMDRLLCKASEPQVITIVGQEGESAADEEEEAEEEEEEEEESDDSSDCAKRRRQRLLTKLRTHPLFHDLQAALLHECLAAPRLPSALLCALPDDVRISSTVFRNGSSSGDGDCAIASPPLPLPSSRRRSFETVSRAVLVAHVQVERDLAGLRPWTNRVGLVLEQSYRTAVAAAESERYAALLYNCHSEDCKRRINAYYDCERLVLAQWAQQHLARRRRDIGLASVVVAAVPARSTEATAAAPESFAAAAAASASVDAGPCSSSCTAAPASAAAAEGGAEGSARVGALSASGELEPVPSNPLNTADVGSAAAFRTPTTSPQPVASLLAAAESGANARRDQFAKAMDDRTSGRVAGASDPPRPDDPQPPSPSASFPSVCVAFDRAPMVTTAAVVGRAASNPAQTGLDREGEGGVLPSLAAWRCSGGDDSCAPPTDAAAAAPFCGESRSSNRSSPQQPLLQQQQLLLDVPLDLSVKSVGAPYSSSSSSSSNSRVSSGGTSASVSSTGQAGSAAGLPPCGGHSGCAHQCSTVGSDAGGAAAAAEFIGGSSSSRAYHQRSPGRSSASGSRNQNADAFGLRSASTEADRHWQRWAATPSLLGSIKDGGSGGGMKKHMLSKYSWDCVSTRSEAADVDRPAADAAPAANSNGTCTGSSPVLPPPPAAAAALHDGRTNRTALTAIVEPGNSPQSDCLPPSLGAATAAVAAAAARLGGRSRATLDDVVAQCLSGQKQRKRRAAPAAQLDQRPKQPAMQLPQQLVQPSQQPLQLSAARRKAAAPAGACWVVNTSSSAAAVAAAASVAGTMSSSPAGAVHQASAAEAIKCSAGGGGVAQQPATASAAVKQEPSSGAAGLYGPAAADYLDLVGGWPAAAPDGSSAGSAGSTTSVLESLRRVVNSVSAKPSDVEKGGCCGIGVGGGGGRWHSASSILHQQQQHMQLHQQQQRTGAAAAAATAGGCEVTSPRQAGQQHPAVGATAGTPVPCAHTEILKLPAAASGAGQPVPAVGCCSGASPASASAAAGSSCTLQAGSKTGDSSPLPVSQQQQTQQQTGKRYLSHHARLILNDWFLKHIRRPYPTLSEKILLAQQCGISSAKVDTWFANKRNRTHNTRKLLPKYSRLVLLKSAAGGGSGSAAVPPASALLHGPAAVAATVTAAAAASDPHRLLSGQPLPALPSL